MATILSRFQLRRDASAVWTPANPVLAAGEPAIETDTVRLRLGDGSTPYNSLRAFLSVPVAAIAAAQAFLNATSAAAQRAALGLADDVGVIGIFGMSTLPTGWLKCNGAAISRAAYPELFTKISTSWGVGDGVTTFNLPDLRGEFVRGWDDGRGVDVGRAFASFQDQLLRNHTHSGTTAAGGDHQHYYDRFSAGAGGVFSAGGSLGVNTSVGTSAVITGAHTHTITTGNPDGGLGGGETRPRNRAVLFAIKYQ